MYLVNRKNSIEFQGHRSQAKVAELDFLPFYRNFTVAR